MVAKVGRKSPYSKAMLQRAAEGAAAGETDKEICKALGIAECTFYVWKNRHPEFAEATSRAKDVANARIEAKAYELAMGSTIRKQQAYKLKDIDGNETVEVVDLEEELPPNERMIQFWLKNRNPDRWRDKQDVELIGGVEFVTYFQPRPDWAKEKS